MTKITSIVLAGSLAVLTALSGRTDADEVYPFRVAFEDLPGVDHLLAGDVARGIRILEQSLEAGTADEGDVLATLCGAYIRKNQLSSAERACADAIERSGTDTAYNNRGVLRAFRGDLEGARRDFSRASPSDMEAYMEVLRARDVSLVAASNRKLLERLTASHSADEVRSSYTPIRSAGIETVDED